MIFRFLKNLILFFVTSSNHSYMISHGYLPEKLSDKTFYSNGQCGWYADTICDMPIWKLKRAIEDKAKMFANDPIKFKLLNQYRAWGVYDKIELETDEIEYVASEFDRLFKEHMEGFDTPIPCIHIYRGKARVGIYRGPLSNKEYVMRELSRWICSKNLTLR